MLIVTSTPKVPNPPILFEDIIKIYEYFNLTTKYYDAMAFVYSDEYLDYKKRYYRIKKINKLLKNG